MFNITGHDRDHSQEPETPRRAILGVPVLSTRITPAGDVTEPWRRYPRHIHGIRSHVRESSVRPRREPYAHGAIAAAAFAASIPLMLHCGFDVSHRRAGHLVAVRVVLGGLSSR